MKLIFTAVLLLLIADRVAAQTKLYSEVCPVCEQNYKFSASINGNTYYLKAGSKLRKKIGSNLSNEEAFSKFVTVITKSMTALCKKKTYSASSFINFANGFSYRAVTHLRFTPRGSAIPLLKDSARLTGALYIGVINTSNAGENKLLISMLGASQPLDILIWDATKRKYALNINALKNQTILNFLPQLLFIKDSIANIYEPNLYLQQKPDKSYEIIASDSIGDGSPTGIILPSKNANALNLSSTAVLLKINGEDDSVASIKDLSPDSKKAKDPTTKIAQAPEWEGVPKMSKASPSDSLRNHLIDSLKTASKKDSAKKNTDTTNITILTAANFDFTGKLTASYLGLFNLFAPHIKHSPIGFLAGIEKINYSPGNINGNDSSQVEYFVQNYIPNPLEVNRQNNLIVAGSKYVQQYNQYTYSASNTVWSFYFQPTWSIISLSDQDSKQGLYFHLHTELLVNQWSRTANIKNLYQSDSITAGTFTPDTNFYWVQKNPIISNYNFLSPYVGAGVTLYVNPFADNENSIFFGQATYGIAYNTPNFQELNNPLDKPLQNGTYATTNITYPKAKAFFLLRFSFSQALSSKSTLEIGTVIRGILPTATPQYAAFLGLNIDLNALASIITGK